MLRLLFAKATAASQHLTRRTWCDTVFSGANTPLHHYKPPIAETITFSTSINTMEIHISMAPTRKRSFAPRPHKTSLAEDKGCTQTGPFRSRSSGGMRHPRGWIELVSGRIKETDMKHIDDLPTCYSKINKAKQPLFAQLGSVLPLIALS
jgi:hypothetical protein